MATSAPISYVEPSRTGLRLVILTFAGLLMLDAIWMAVPQLSRFAWDTANDRAGACAAARMTLVRGDLWAECALADVNPLRAGPPVEDAGMSAVMAMRARGAVERALVLAPHDARMWVVLAGLEARFDRASSNAAAALRMSYYTGPNETGLIPMRLATFARLDASGDNDLQQLVRREIANVVTKRPEFKGAIVAAYREALPAGKRLFEDTLRDLDPKFLGSLHS